MTWAMVTGASSGLGAEFARQLADAGHDVVLVARDKARLAEVAAEVRGSGVDAQVLRADLSTTAGQDRVARELRRSTNPIAVLINNAGYGVGESFVGSDVAAQRDALAVMVGAVMVLSHAAAEAMVAHGAGRILNVSSVASLLPSTVYSAHKRWVVHFSETLANQLHGTGVTVTATRPGFVRTPFQYRAGLDYSQLPAWSWTAAEPVVRQSLRAMNRGRIVVTPTLRYALIATAARVSPPALLRRLTRTRVEP